MQFSIVALAAFLTARAHGACPANRPHHYGGNSGPTTVASARPAFTYSVLPSNPAEVLPYGYVPKPLPTTEPLPTIEPVPTTSPTTFSTRTSVIPAATIVPTTPPTIPSPAPASVAPAPAASSAPPAADASLSTDQVNAVSSQNAARADVGAAPLTWNATLASDAQAWADHLAQGTPGSLVHATQSTEGENLYWSSAGGDPYAAAAKAWLDEKSKYDGLPITGGGNFKDFGHYSEFLWFSHLS